jgi:uncharacterized protein involved in exopolysaccharide biosynthesis
MTARQRLAELLEQTVRKLVIALVTYEGGFRVKPATIERFREILSDALLAAKQISDMYGAQHDGVPTADELADTRPMRTHPPPPPKPKA